MRRSARWIGTFFAPGEGLGQLVRSALTSAVATGMDFLLVVLLVQRASLFPGVATLFGALLGAVVNYTLNRFWAFRTRGPAVGEIVRYALVSASTALLNAGGVSVLVSFRIPYRLAWLAVRAVVFLAFTFVMFRGFVFRRREPNPSAMDAPP